MNDVAYNTGFMFSNPAAPNDNKRDSDEDINGHGAALASSGYNLNGMVGNINNVNSAGNLQMMNNDLLMGAISNQLANNIIQAPAVQNNQAPIGMNFGSFLFNPLAMFYQQQHPPAVPQQMQAAPLPDASAVVAAAAAAAALPPQSNQYFTPSQSPMPQAFFTPHSGTPNPPTPPPTYDVNQGLGMSKSLPQAFVPQTAVTQENVTTTNKRKAPDQNIPPTSLIRQGISSVGSALGVVATYINKSLLSGIPFHIADRAMKDSKETYSRWWDQTVNDGNGEDEERARKGSTDDEDMDDDSDDGPPVTKKRKIVDHEYGRASSLSQKLAGNYNDANIEAVKKNWRVGKSEVLESQVPADVQVDSSIIGPPRRQAPASRGGYDAFNSVGSMYGGDMYSSNDVVVASKSTAAINGGGGPGNYSLSYDSLSGYYLNSTEEDERKLAAIPTPPAKKDDDDNIGNNTLGHTLQAIKEIIDEKNRDSEEQEIFQMSFKNPRDWVTKTIRSELVDALQSVQGDVTTKRFTSSLEVLSRFYNASGRDARVNPWCGGGSTVGGPSGADLLEGSWLNISRPNYVECIGQNAENDFMYTLGRMSFDIFQPSNLICSVQSTHNTIKMIGEREELPACVPKSLKEEVALLCNSSDGDSASKRPFLRSYDIAVSMTIEPPSLVGQPEPTTTPSPAKRMRAVMSVKGYILPDPETKNRLTVWFTGGSLGPAKLSSNDGDETDDEEEHINSEGDGYGGFEEWNSIFGKGKWRKALSERARGMAAKVLLGVDAPSKMEDNGQMGYSLNRPVGGHGKAYIDVLYLDDDLLIMKGHHGTIYAMARSCVSQRYRNLQASASASRA